MATRKEKVDAGLFLLIGVLLLATTIAVVAGVNLERQGDAYLIKIPKSVGGLREGSVVKYLGVNVGRVKTVDFPAEDVESVRVAIEITHPSTPIKSGTFATLSSNFLTGETSIELQGGSNEDVRLLPGSLVPWRPSTISRLEDALPGVVDELKRVAANLNALLGAENQGRVAKLIDEVHNLAAELNARVGPLQDELHGLRTSLSDSGVRIADAAGSLKEDVSASVARGMADLGRGSQSVVTLSDKLGAATDDLPRIVAALERASARLDHLLAGVDLLVDDNRDDVGRVLAQFEASARELEQLVERLERNPSDLLFSEPRLERERGANPAGKPDKGGS